MFRGKGGEGEDDHEAGEGGERNAFTCSVGADLGRAAEKPLVADR